MTFERASHIQQQIDQLERDIETWRSRGFEPRAMIGALAYRKRELQAAHGARTVRALGSSSSAGVSVLNLY